MNEKIKVVFIGGLSNGKIVYEYLQKNRYVDLELVITYPDGTDKPRHVDFPAKSNIVKSSSVKEHGNTIREIGPDFIFVAGWSELLPEEVVNVPAKGTIGFHPSKLPADRGRSVLAWQIEEGYTETALTMFYYSKVPDAGDIIAREKIEISNNDYISDVLDKVDGATYNLMKAYFPLLRKSMAPRLPQNEKEASYRRLRGKEDSLIDWNQDVKNIYNKIRAISNPYPGAETEMSGKRIKIWEAELVDSLRFEFLLGQYGCGEILAKLKNNMYLVGCRDGVLKIRSDHALEPGYRL